MQFKDNSPACIVMIIFISAIAKHCLWSGPQTVAVVLRFAKERSLGVFLFGFLWVVFFLLLFSFFRWCWRLGFFLFLPLSLREFSPTCFLGDNNGWYLTEMKEVVKVGRRDEAGSSL